jgi:hypothetical protein
MVGQSHGFLACRLYSWGFSFKKAKGSLDLASAGVPIEAFGEKDGLGGSEIQGYGAVFSDHGRSISRSLDLSG